MQGKVESGRMTQVGIEVGVDRPVGWCLGHRGDVWACMLYVRGLRLDVWTPVGRAREQVWGEGSRAYLGHVVFAAPIVCLMCTGGDAGVR